jgi:hypothetical protein
VSGYTQTTNEVLYSFAGASTNLATFTTEDNLLKTYPLCQVPGSYFGAGAVGGLSKALRIKAGGQMGYTTGSPTFLWSIRAIASTTWSAGGLLLGATAAVAATASAVVTAPWFLDTDVTLRTAAVAAGTATVVTMGEVRAPTALLVPSATIPSLAVSPALATWDINATYYLFLSCACSASNSLNLINTQYMKVYGEN